MLNPPRESSRPRFPAMAGPEGFQPIVPIRVHLARDEEAGTLSEGELTDDNTDVEDIEKSTLPPPPPAYGLWRSSVRADPNLLHWQRAEPHVVHTPVLPDSRNYSRSAPDQSSSDGPRPPSYVSEDGVSYIVDAAPRSMVGNSQDPTGGSDIHPAWRPGYAMSEIRGNEPGWPLARGAYGEI